MKNKKIKIALVLLISFICVIVVFSKFFFSEKNVIEFKMYLKVENYTGVNVDVDAIYFGTVPPGGESKRNILLWHNYTKPKKIFIITNGELANWVTVFDNNFILEPNKNITITVTVKVPFDAKFKNYTGNLKIFLK